MAQTRYVSLTWDLLVAVLSVVVSRARAQTSPFSGDSSVRARITVDQSTFTIHPSFASYLRCARGLSIMPMQYRERQCNIRCARGNIAECVKDEIRKFWSLTRIASLLFKLAKFKKSSYPHCLSQYKIHAKISRASD